MEATILDFTAIANELPKELYETPYLVTLKTAAAAQVERPPLKLHIVIDNSGSMSMEHRLQNIKDTLIHLLPYLDNPNDTITLYTFNNIIKEYGTFRVDMFNDFKECITAIHANGGTNIEGIFKTLANKKIAKDEAILFLTDGQPTIGITDCQYLLNMVDTISGQEFVVVGYGIGHDADLLERVSKMKNGSYYSIFNRAAVGQTVGNIIGGLASTVATNIEVYSADNKILCKPPNMIANGEYTFLTSSVPTNISYNIPTEEATKSAIITLKAATVDNIQSAIQEYIRKRITESVLTIAEIKSLYNLSHGLPATTMGNILKEELKDMMKGNNAHQHQHRSFFRQQRGLLTPSAPGRHYTEIANDVQRSISNNLTQSLDDPHKYDNNIYTPTTLDPMYMCPPIEDNILIPPN